MPTVSPSQSNSGDLITAASINTPVNQLGAVVNGGIDSTNLADNAVTTAKLAASSVTNVKLSTNAGELGGSWQTFTPTWTGITVGNGTTTGAYSQIGKTIHARYSFTFGSTSAVGTGKPTFTLPVTANTFYNGIIISVGTAIINDTSAATAYVADVAINGSTTTGTVGRPSSDPPQFFVLSSATPMAWAAGDTLCFTIVYEAA